jgi:hypothetical protein
MRTKWVVAGHETLHATLDAEPDSHASDQAALPRLRCVDERTETKVDLYAVRVFFIKRISRSAAEVNFFDLAHRADLLPIWEPP